MPKSAHSADHEALEQILRELRLEAGLNQRDLAVRLGLPQSFVSKYENGERRLDLVELSHVCTALGIPLRLLVERFVNRTP